MMAVNYRKKKMRRRRMGHVFVAQRARAMALTVMCGKATWTSFSVSASRKGRSSSRSVDSWTANERVSE